MQKKGRLASFALFAISAGIAAFSAMGSPEVLVPSVGKVSVKCAKPGAWTFDLVASKDTDGTDVVTVRLKAASSAVPPVFSLEWTVSQRDVHHLWSSESTHYGAPFGRNAIASEISNGLPLYSFLDANDHNRFTFAASESCRRVLFSSAISEKGMNYPCSFTFFTVPEAPLSAYEAQVRFDARNVFYGEAIGAASDWMCRAAGITPLPAPKSAFDPLYSTWYTFHQDVTAPLVDEELALAAKLGMKTVIVDDGWQIDLPPGKRPFGGYSYCGDWKAGFNFPDMAAHVARAHALGFKYMLWYSVPFVGEKSANFGRFKGKCFPANNCCAGAWVLDPRFPEVREFLIDTYVKAMRDWDLDGFKFDFIGRFVLKGPDSAVAENYAGRDIRVIPQAVERLLADAMARLRAIKPDVLIEFRQVYIGPCIRSFGNMIRATDCPLSMVENRTRTARLRLTSGKTAVHADMLEWRADETPESAARAILNALFSVVQYSVRLATLPPEHTRMLEHWIRFSQAHRAALVEGAFRPHAPAADYPLLEGESASERIWGVYLENLTVPTGTMDRPVYIVNGANASSVVVDFADAAEVVAYDTFGTRVSTATVEAPGVRRMSVPVSGFLEIRRAPRTVLELPWGPDNPRNSEGDFAVLNDGRILYVYSHYVKGKGGDHDPAILASRVSSDGGMTWSTNSVKVLDREGDMNVMSVSLLRLEEGPLALFYLVKNSESDCRPAMRLSTDDGATWGPRTMCVGETEKGYYVLNNARVVRLKSGRLVLPMCEHASKNGRTSDWRGRLVCYLSDDAGRSWRRGKSGLFETYDADGQRVTTQEPGVIELKDGRVLMFARTMHGRQWFYYSSDGCETWTRGEPGSLWGPCGPATVRRLANGDLVAIWNDHEFLPDLAAEDTPKGRGGRRVPLTVGISKDDGRTWPLRRELEGDRTGWYCYIAALECDGRLLLGYCARDGLRHSRLKSVPLDWLYVK